MPLIIYKELADVYHRDPETNIKNHFGNDIKILNYEELNEILPNNYIKIKVEYENLDLNPLITRYIKKKDLKVLNKSRDEYIAKIEGENVYFKITEKVPEVFPVIIFPVLNKKEFYRYSGLVAAKSEILHAWSSLTNNIFKVPEVKSKPFKEIYTKDQTLTNYKRMILKIEDLKHITQIEEKTNMEIDENSSIFKAYILDVKYLKENQGCVVIITQRMSSLILWYPFKGSGLNSETVRFIQDFIMFDKSNLAEFKS